MPTAAGLYKDGTEPFIEKELLKLELGLTGDSTEGPLWASSWGKLTNAVIN